MYNTNELLLKISSGQTHFPVEKKYEGAFTPTPVKKNNKKLLYLLKG